MKTNVVGKNVADPTIEKSKKFLPNLNYQLKNKYPPLARNFTKRYHSV
jgi:hypothetical protein